MPRTIPVQPELPAFVETLELGGQTLRIRLRWRPRLERWYLAVFDSDGTAIRTGKKIEPGTWPLALSLDGDTFGNLYVKAPLDDYDRDDLGDTVELIYVSPSEIDELLA